MPSAKPPRNPECHIGGIEFNLRGGRDGKRQALTAVGFRRRECVPPMLDKLPPGSVMTFRDHDTAVLQAATCSIRKRGAGRQDVGRELGGLAKDHLRRRQIRMVRR